MRFALVLVALLTACGGASFSGSGAKRTADPERPKAKEPPPVTADAVRSEPAKEEPVKAEPVKEEPVKAEAAQTAATTDARPPCVNEYLDGKKVDPVSGRRFLYIGTAADFCGSADLCRSRGGDLVVAGMKASAGILACFGQVSGWVRWSEDSRDYDRWCRGGLGLVNDDVYVFDAETWTPEYRAPAVLCLL